MTDRCCHNQTCAAHRHLIAVHSIRQTLLTLLHSDEERRAVLAALVADYGPAVEGGDAAEADREVGRGWS